MIIGIFNSNFSFPGRHKGGTSSFSTSSSSSRISVNEMELIIDKLLYQTVRKLTRQNYVTIWRQFNGFLVHLDKMPQDWEDRTSLFCAFLIEKGLQSATVKSYISAIKTGLKGEKYPWEECKLLLNSLTKACKIKNDNLTCRLLIQKGLFEMLLFEIP